jgi:cytidine deaminase
VPRLDEKSIDKLAKKAWETWLWAYAPYSQFRVGAALMGADGRIFTGANVENASFGLAMCAERVAVGAAAAAGVRAFVALAIAGDDPQGVSPCGACRQVLSEFSQNLLIIRCKPDGTYTKSLLRDLMPAPFNGRTITLAEERMEVAGRT